jgi:hypothetical protein
MRGGILEEILIGLSVLMGLVSAIAADTVGVPALKWLGIAMVVAGAVAIAVKRRR